MTTSNGRSALQYAKYACLHPVPETRSLPDVGFRDKRARSRQSPCRIDEGVYPNEASEGCCGSTKSIGGFAA